MHSSFKSGELLIHDMKYMNFEIIMLNERLRFSRLPINLYYLWEMSIKGKTLGRESILVIGDGSGKRNDL
jgi:hypothetical protein